MAEELVHVDGRESNEQEADEQKKYEKVVMDEGIEEWW